MGEVSKRDENGIILVQSDVTNGSRGNKYLYDAGGNRIAKGSITSWSRDTSSNGFTLMELLMVILILLLMAIPTFGGIKKHPNETWAIVSMQTIEAAEIMYASTYPTTAFSILLFTETV